MVNSYEEKIKTLRKIIEGSNNIVFFGGAGVSTESNIPDFRSTKNEENGIEGIYQNQGAYKYPPETIISHTFFMNNPEYFYKFYFDKMVYENSLPNDAHKALTYLENQGKLKAIVTQNIDNLHQASGSKNVYELHGSVYRNHCMKCHKFYSLEELLKRKEHPYCDCGGLIKPDVVLYEEGLDSQVINEALNKIINAEVLIVAGTSLLVEPAASFVSYFRGRYLVIINLEPTPYDRYASLVIREKVGKTLKEAIIESNSLSV